MNIPNEIEVSATTTSNNEAGTTQIRTAVALSFAARLSTIVLALISSMVIARLLTPAEMGVYAVGLAITAFLEIFRDFGVSNYLIQEQHISREKIRAAFSVTLLLAWGAGGLLLTVSRPASTFYGAPALAAVLSVLSISFFLLPLGAPALGLLRRQLRFAALYRIGVGSNFATAVMSIGLAAWGFGPVSMAWGSVAGAATLTICACVASPSHALMAPTLRGWRPVLVFGGQSTLAGVIVQLSDSGLQLLIGRLLGLSALGFFSRAYNLVLNARTSVFGSLANVALPVLAARIRDGRDIREPYLRACGLLTGVIWPIQGFLIIMAFPLFRVLYGPAWDAAVPLFRLLVLGDVAFQALAFVGPVLLAFGRVDYLVRGEMVVQAIRLILIVPAALTSLEAVCVVEVLHYAFFLAVFGRKLRSLMGLSFRTLAGVHAKSLVVATCSLVGPGLSVLVFGFFPERPGLPLMVAAAGASAGWLLGVFLSKHDLRSEIGRTIDWLPRLRWYGSP